jgi:hypothetical protein
MRKLLIFSLNSTAILSAAFCAVMFALWVGSYSNPSAPFERLPLPGDAASSIAGVLTLRRAFPGDKVALCVYAESTRRMTDADAFVESVQQWRVPGVSSYGLVLNVSGQGVVFAKYPMGWEARISYLLPMLAGAFLSVAIGLKRTIRLSSRGSELRCRLCGYDVRSSPQRCPECATPRGAERSKG